MNAATPVKADTTLRILLFSDLQVDRPYTWASANVAEARRAAAREVLVTILGDARARGIDLIACAGNLFNRRTVRPSSIRWLATAFRSTGVPVLIAPGSDDYVGPLGGYVRGDWPDNVVLFERDEFTPVEVADGITIWGAAHTEAHRRRGFFDGLEVHREGVNFALFHGTEASALEREPDLDPAALFDEDDVEAAGFDHALVGRCREPHLGGVHTYPGVALPHDFGTVTPGGGVLVTLRSDGLIDREMVEVPSLPLCEITLDLTGAATPKEVLHAAAESLAGRHGVVRLHLVGRTPVEVLGGAVDFTELKASGCAVLPSWETTVDADLEQLADEQTVRGEFARELLGADISDQRRARIAGMGLRALSGDGDLEHLS